MTVNDGQPQCLPDTNTFQTQKNNGDNNMRKIQPPYTITHAMWSNYYDVQQSGRINMMMHPNVIYFMSHNSWQKSFDHFETNAQTDPLTIEVKV